MKRTLRLLLFWECNLKCTYCCNEIPEIRKGIKDITLPEIDWDQYEDVCISGGEPFLDKALLVSTLGLLKTNHPEKDVYIYSNGTRTSMEDIRDLETKYTNVKGLNIGLHDEYGVTWDNLIDKFKDVKLVRFHMDETYKTFVESKYRKVKDKFHYWKRNDCEQENEDIFVLKKY